MKETIIALASTNFSKIKIQTVIYQKKGSTYIYSVNILCGTKIIKKIKQKPGEVKMEVYKSEQIVSDYLLKTFLSEKKKVVNPSRKTKKRAVKSIM
jgi:hypothetical protein